MLLLKILNVFRYPIKSSHFQIKKLSTISHPKNYDLIVVGGTLGGLAAAREATALGAKVLVLDQLHSNYIFLRGILKKVMHKAALLGEACTDAANYGWVIDKQVNHKWENLRKTVKTHMDNVKLLDHNAAFENIFHGLGTFLDPHTISLISSSENCVSLSSKIFLLSLGTRSLHPKTPAGAKEYGISCDDVFHLDRPPGKTLIIGNEIEGFECAGILSLLGQDVTMMVGTEVLKGIDRQMANIITSMMIKKNIRFLSECQLKPIDKLPNGKLKILWNDPSKKLHAEEFDTLVFAIGRRTLIEGLHLEKVGVSTVPLTSKIETFNDQTNISHIYAIGEILHEKPESYNLSIQAGRLLAKRLFGNSHELMDYENAPTTIFTPLEYSFVGLSEETAITRFGEENLEIYHSYYKPAEFFIAKRDVSNCYLKVIALRRGDQRVLGMHFIGPEAEHVIQGFSTAMKCKLTVEALMNTVGMHPTVAEEFTRIRITKRSGLDPTPASCCS
ncbi:hypothetical protein ABEB36_009669 [Hypothenemus hampei]|uniref:Uncharacterized protein n=1 Tax=Hypothenemus hampei TaxID=57062 RepID=A0ABD1EH60_HYPHA